MEFSIQREALLKPLNQVIGVVERRQTLPILANVLATLESGTLALVGTDLEIEMLAHTAVEGSDQLEITIPARKMFDICRALPDGAKLEIKLSNDRVSIKAGKSRFTLATLPASDFPQIDNLVILEKFALKEKVLKQLMDRTSFAMANQDVRYYLNGLLLDLQPNSLKSVATDGHRLALCEVPFDNQNAIVEPRQIILPRKAVLELQRLLDNTDNELQVEICKNHIRIKHNDFTFVSKLIDGRFPDYEAVLPIGADKSVVVARDEFKSSLQRAAILSNEKYRGVKLEISPNAIQIAAHNPEQEEAVEELEAKTTADGLNVGFNVNYLLDALNALQGSEVVLHLRDMNSSCLIQDLNDGHARHVVMPLRL